MIRFEEPLPMLHHSQPPLSADDRPEDGAGRPSFLSRYLARIGLASRPAPTLEGLALLQAAHQAAIPFESFDALTGAGVDIAPEAIEAKLVDRGRGGYCFEQNALFLRVLSELGFDAEGLIGRVRWMLPDDAPATPRTHMTIRVRLGGRPWLVDVGFGATVSPQPLAMPQSRASGACCTTSKMRRRPRSITRSATGTHRSIPPRTSATSLSRLGRRTRPGTACATTG
jgi:N-hydroxyarylamine O-acetyltransferase